MIKQLSWFIRKETLVLKGNLNRDTLSVLWLKRRILLDGIRFLDVSGLKYIDSAGIALIMHLYYQKRKNCSFMIIGVTNQMRTLIMLYKLQEILPCF